MSANLSPLFNAATQLTNQGVILAGGKISTYLAGTTTPQATYTSSTQITPNANPIILGSDGRSSAEIWLTAGISYKFILSDANNNILGTYDNIVGINDFSIAVTQWISSPLTPTYISGTSFSLAGDQTIDFHPGRRVMFSVSAGTVYGTILTSAYTSLTTLTMLMDGVTALDNGLLTVSVGLLRADVSALPQVVINEKHGANIASASTINLNNATGNVVDVTGTTTITTITLSEGYERVVRFTGALILTNGASLVIPGGANYTTAAGDYFRFRGYASGVVRVTDYSLASGFSITPPVFVPVRKQKITSTTNFTTGSSVTTLYLSGIGGGGGGGGSGASPATGATGGTVTFGGLLTLAGGIGGGGGGVTGDIIGGASGAGKGFVGGNALSLNTSGSGGGAGGGACQTTNLATGNSAAANTGGGGGGGGPQSGSYVPSAGGGSGEIANSVAVTVTPNTLYTVTINAGGAGGNGGSTTGGAGGSGYLLIEW